MRRGEICGDEGSGEPWTWGMLKIWCAMLMWVHAGGSLRKRGSCGWNYGVDADLYMSATVRSSSDCR